jgi:hypothetical protein
MNSLMRQSKQLASITNTDAKIGNQNTGSLGRRLLKFGRLLFSSFSSSRNLVQQAASRSTSRHGNLPHAPWSFHYYEGLLCRFNEPTLKLCKNCLFPVLECRFGMVGDSKNHLPPDKPDKAPDAPSDIKPLQGRDTDAARNSDTAAMAAVEKRRTNRSSGSLAAEQEHSIEIQMDDGNIVSRRSQSQLPTVGAGADTDSKRLNSINLTPADTSGQVLKAGLTYQESPIKNAGVQNIGDVEQKFRGIAEGLSEAVVANVAELAKDPEATNKGFSAVLHKAGDAIVHVADKTAHQDLKGISDDAAKLAQNLAEASDKYSGMSQYEQGRFIGREVMPNFIPDLPGAIEEARAIQKSEDVLRHADHTRLYEREEHTPLAGKGGEWPVLNERPSQEVVRQIRGKSCVSACGEMISDGRLRQADLIEALGMPADTRLLAKHLGPGWRGRYLDDVKVPEKLFQNGPFVADLREHTKPGHRINDAHAVVVDGLDSAGNVMVRDPQDGTRYEMTRSNFDKYWTGCAVYKEVPKE